LNVAEITGELALVVSLTLALQKKIKAGRLKKQLQQLQKACEKEFRRLPPIGTKVDAVNRKIVSFSENCGWADEVEVITYISFLLGLIEQSDYHYPMSIINILNNINDFVTDGRDYRGHCKLADHALDVWEAYEKIS